MKWFQELAKAMKLYMVYENDRSSDSFLKRFTAQSFYRLQSSLGVDAVYNHADYRLMSKRAVLALSQFREVNLFLRGLVPLVGFKSCCVYYSRGKRFAGESKYTLGKMLSFAFEGITSFSTKPIRIITLTGLIISIFSLFCTCISFNWSFYWRCTSWLDKHYYVNLVSWRTSTFGFGCHRRVRWKDLYGDEASSSLFY